MSEPEYDVPAVRKAIRLIELLCDSVPPMGISEISQRLELNKNMVFRLLRTLSEIGWVVPDHDDPYKYRMTLQPFHLVSKPVNRMSVRVAAQEPLRQLWASTQQSCYLCLLDQQRALCIEHIDAVGDMRIGGRVGGRYYLHATAPGKVLLAYAGEELLKKLGKGDLPALTRFTLTDKKALKAHLAQMADQGFAIDDQENVEGVLCFAAPIFNYDDQVVGALGLSTLTFDYSRQQLIEQLGPLVIDAARAASQILGATADHAPSAEPAN